MNQLQKKSDVPFYLGLATAFIALVAFVWFVVWMIMDVEHQKDMEQKKQDACLKAGGMWIDNRRTEPYCFFNN